MSIRIFKTHKPIFNKLETEWNDLYQNMMQTHWESLPEGQFDPLWDVIESPKGLHIHLDVPGIIEDKLNVDLEDSLLTIKGERQETQEEDGNWIHRRPSGSFTKRLKLGTNLDGNSIEAKLFLGVLSLFIPKKEETKPRSIAIEIAK